MNEREYETDKQYSRRVVQYCRIESTDSFSNAMNMATTGNTFVVHKQSLLLLSVG